VANYSIAPEIHALSIHHSGGMEVSKRARYVDIEISQGRQEKLKFNGPDPSKAVNKVQRCGGGPPTRFSAHFRGGKREAPQD
jgi:hypothetical protein